MEIGELVGGLSRVLKLKSEEAEKLEAKLRFEFGKTYDLSEWFKVPQYLRMIDEQTRDMRNFILYQIWERIIRAVHDTTTLIDRLGFRAEADVAPGATYKETVDLVDLDVACMCPWAKYRATIGDVVILNNTVNGLPQAKKKVKSDWLNKKPFINEPMPTEFQRAFYVEIPKVTVEVEFTNESPDYSSTAKFYAPFDKMEIEKAKRVVEWATEYLARRWIEITTG
jgi:hypothetical protein